MGSFLIKIDKKNSDYLLENEIVGSQFESVIHSAVKRMTMSSKIDPGKSFEPIGKPTYTYPPIREQYFEIILRLRRDLYCNVL